MKIIAHIDMFRTSAQILARKHSMHQLVAGFTIVSSIAVLAAMLTYYWPAVVAYPWEIRFWPLGLTIIVYLLNSMIAVFAWGKTMEYLGHSLGFRTHFRIYSLTTVIARIPGVPWHIAGRAVLYKEIGIDPRITGIASGLEVVLIILSGLVSSVCIWFSLPQRIQTQLIWLSVLIPAGLCLVHPRVIKFVLGRMSNTQVGNLFRYRDMLSLLIAYLVSWVIGGCILYTLILSIHPLPLAQLPGVIGAWSLSGALGSLAFLSPTSFGIKEIALSLLLAIFVPPGLSILAAIFMRLFLTAADFTIAVVASRL